MASKRIIEVRIHGQLKEKTNKSEPKNDIDSDLNIDNLFDNVIVNQVASELRSQLSEMAIYGINRHLELTDNYMGQRYLKAGLDVIGRSMSFGKAVYAGAKTGGVVGAILGAVFSIGDMTFDIVKNYDQQNILLKQMDKQLQYQRQRAGYSLTSGSIGENR